MENYMMNADTSKTIAVHWSKIDEDISVRALMQYVT